MNFEEALIAMKSGKTCSHVSDGENVYYRFGKTIVQFHDETKIKEEGIYYQWETEVDWRFHNDVEMDLIISDKWEVL